MKKVITTILLFAGMVASFNVKAQSQTMKPNYVHYAYFEASADAVWETLRKLDGVENFAPGLFHKTSLNTKQPEQGCQRTCVFPDNKGVMKETFLEYNDATRFFKYRIDEGLPVKSMANTMQVIDLGYKKSMFVWTTTYEFMENPNMTKVQFADLLKSSIIAIEAGLQQKHNNK